MEVWREEQTNTETKGKEKGNGKLMKKNTLLKTERNIRRSEGSAGNEMLNKGKTKEKKSWDTCKAVRGLFVNLRH